MNTISVENVNRTFPRYPITVEDKGWVYGVWYCGTSWTKVKLHGQYPPTFLKRALALFPDAKDILHAPSGQLQDIPGITIDLIEDDIRRPEIVGNCNALPFQDETFDQMLVADCHYSVAAYQIFWASF